MSPQELAQAILAEPRITLATRHVSGVQDEATARHNIEQTAAGQPARRSSYGNAPGGTVELSAEMLSAILDLARRFTFSISEIAGASHSKRSRHYAGVGFDVNVIDGRRVGADHPGLAGFLEGARQLGATERIGPPSAGHATHVHCAWPRPARNIHFGIESEMEAEDDEEIVCECEAPEAEASAQSPA